MSTQHDIPVRFLRTPEAAQHLGLSSRTLEKHRVYGTGPCFLKLGGRVVYRVEDLQTWAARGVRTSTCDPGIGVVLSAKRHDPETVALATPSREPIAQSRTRRQR